VTQGSAQASARCLYVTPEGELRQDLPPEEWSRVLDEGKGVLWVDITGDGPDAESILRDVFHFHPLAIDDALRQRHVPRVDDWDDYLYVVVAALGLNESPFEMTHEELDLFLGPNYLVSLHDVPLDALNKAWTAASMHQRHMHQGSDYLLYEVLDALAADYLLVADKLDAAIDDVEDEIFTNPPADILDRFFRLKRALLDMRRLLTPTREALNRLARDEYAQIDERDRIYFRDIYDHLVRLVDINESLRDLVSGAMDMYLTVVSNRLNEVMKILTVVTLLFMPVTFITGFFGMNFFGGSYELRLPNGAPAMFGATLASLAVTPLAMLWWIRRKGWM